MRVRIFFEVMASDEAIREGSRAWSGGWLSHRLAAAQHLACELSDERERSVPSPRLTAPRAPTVARRHISLRRPDHLQPTGCPVRAHHRRPRCRAVPEPFNLWIPEPCAHSP
ncbi:hypothetical protein TYRP_016220 [Tyrophagus putrescentiae]|nr:hypothetical protein TYRP_016220 [Tyrophagus putrescentiae]